MLAYQHEPVRPLFAHEDELLVENCLELLEAADTSRFIAQAIVGGGIYFVAMVLFLLIACITPSKDKIE